MAAKGATGTTKSRKTIMKHAQAMVEEALTGKVKIEDEELGEKREITLPDKGFEVQALPLPPDDSDLHTIVVLVMGILGPENAFAGGEYLLKLMLVPAGGAAQGYPYDPPDFTFLTPNGVYAPNTNTPCVSIGKYHAQEMRGVQGYTAGLKFRGFANAIVGTFTDPTSLGGGINITTGDMNPKTWRKLAAESRAYNEKHHPDLMEKLDKLYDMKKRRAYWEKQTESATGGGEAKKPAAN
jgi:ubiquitin-protein ligase